MKALKAHLGQIGLSAHALKSIAIGAMLIDHIAWAFVPFWSVQGQLMHIIGRLTAPIMCYFIAEGYHRTGNLKRYAARLGVFALISHAPYYYFEVGRFPISAAHGISFVPTSVIFTLFLGLIALTVWHSKTLPNLAKGLLISLLCVLANAGDWIFVGVLWILFFGVYYRDFKKQAVAFSIVTGALVLYCTVLGLSAGIPLKFQFYQTAVLLALPLLRLYNGKLGGHKNLKWLFYVFYPAHLLIIGLILYR